MAVIPLNYRKQEMWPWYGGLWVVLGGEQQFIEQEGVLAAKFGTNKTK